MSERKVLQKYYPPDFDPSGVKRTRGPKGAGPKTQVVRLMAPFSMRCEACGEFIYKGRKFNARKETPPDEKYLNIQIYRFYIRCTRCSGEITFKTDPMNMDYVCERGARRNFEAWRPSDQPEESVEERLDRLEREEGEEGDRDAMLDLETKAQQLRNEETIGDALDSIRIRNAERDRAAAGALPNSVVQPEKEVEQEDEQELRDAQLAKEIFQKKRVLEDVTEDSEGKSDTHARSWKVVKKQKKSLLPGIKRKLEV